jgi:hypothetical protein
MSFVVDTGSAWMWVPSSSCPQEECTGARYDYESSNTFVTTNRTMDVNYGWGYLEGHISKDQVTLSPRPASDKDIARQIDFLNVFHAKDLAGIVSDGLLGMAPAPPLGHPADIFVNELF